GINAIVCDPGETIDTEHDETDSGQQEAYIVVAGRAEFRIGTDVAQAGPGTVIAVADTAVTRSFRPLEPGTRVVCVGAVPAGGTVEKFIGDAVMAVFGLPQAHEDDALRAVRAALDMRAGLDELNADLERRYGVTMANHTGVNTGEVVTAEAAGNQRLATGDAVNVAARLEQAAPATE